MAKSIHIGEILRKHVAEKKYNQAALARREGWKARNVAYYFSRPSIPTSALIMLCNGLRYNFLRDLADELPQEYPSKKPEALQQRIAELEKENERLKIEVEVLERISSKFKVQS